MRSHFEPFAGGESNKGDLKIPSLTLNIFDSLDLGDRSSEESDGGGYISISGTVVVPLESHDGRTALGQRRATSSIGSISTLRSSSIFFLPNRSI